MTSANGRVLLVEHGSAQAERIRRLLEREGYGVEVAANGREGLRRARATLPDLIISEVGLPEMDGYAFCQAIKRREKTRQIRFILFTQRHAPMDIIEGLMRGADDFIPKGSPDEYFLARLRRTFQQLECRKAGEVSIEIVVRVNGHEIPISADKQQMFELLISSVEDAGRDHERLNEAQRLLQEHARQLEARVEERTRELGKLWEAVEQTSVSIVITDRTGAIEYVNRAFCATTGYAPEEVIGRNPRLLQSGETPAELYAEMWARITSGETWHGELCNRKKNGDRFWEQAVISPVRNAQGEVTHFIASKLDVTHSRQLEQQLVQAQKMEAIGRLAGGVAHDFNNLLGVITGYTEMLSRQLGSDHAGLPRLNQVRKAADRAAGLTRQLLAFSRKQVLQPKVLDLNAVVEDVDNMLRRVIGEDVDLVLRLSPALGPVRADPGQIEQVLLNLAVNARDAMPEGGALVIETGEVELDAGYTRTHPGVEPGLYVVMAVSDSGCGMSPGTLAHIFEPFFTTKGTGTGLGLATVYGIVKQSGGSVSVYSEPGQGSTFTVYLPRVTDAAEAEVESLAVDEPPPLGHETVLLVEDDEPLRAVIQEALESGGYTVMEACGADEALSAARSRQDPIHLLLTDVVMPGMNGGDVHARVAELHPETRVVFMSGYPGEVISTRGMLNGAMPYLQKPFTSNALLRTVREVLDAARY